MENSSSHQVWGKVAFFCDDNSEETPSNSYSAPANDGKHVLTKYGLISLQEKSSLRRAGKAANVQMLRKKDIFRIR